MVSNEPMAGGKNMLQIPPSGLCWKEAGEEKIVQNIGHTGLFVNRKSNCIHMENNIVNIFRMLAPVNFSLDKGCIIWYIFQGFEIMNSGAGHVPEFFVC